MSHPAGGSYSHLTVEDYARKGKMTTRRAFLIDAMARAMAKRNGAPIDNMRPSTWGKYRYTAEAALEAIEAEIRDTCP